MKPRFANEAERKEHVKAMRRQRFLWWVRKIRWWLRRTR